MFARELMKIRSAFFALMAVFVFAAPSYAAEHSFQRLPGRWVGNGWLQMSSGDRETIRCTATYFVKNGGKSLKQNLRCASASYTVISRGELSHRGGKITGTWREETFDLSGKVTGTTSGSLMKLVVRGKNFNADFMVTTTGRKQTVVISATGSNIKKMVINLRRS